MNYEQGRVTIQTDKKGILTGVYSDDLCLGILLLWRKTGYTITLF